MSDEKARVAEDRSRLQQMQNDYHKVFMRTAAGRRVLQDLLAFTRVFELSFTGNSQTFYNEGQRSVGLKILEALDKKTFAGLQELSQQNVVDMDLYTE